MAADVQIALQAQASQEPEVALATAAVRLARATLATLAQQLGVTLAGQVVEAPGLPQGFTQIVTANQTLTFKLSTPLPVGTPVTIDIASAGVERSPQVTIRPALPTAVSEPVQQPKSPSAGVGLQQTVSEAARAPVKVSPAAAAPTIAERMTLGPTSAPPSTEAQRPVAPATGQAPRVWPPSTNGSTSGTVPMTTVAGSAPSAVAPAPGPGAPPAVPAVPTTELSTSGPSVRDGTVRPSTAPSTAVPAATSPMGRVAPAMPATSASSAAPVAAAEVAALAAPPVAPKIQPVAAASGRPDVAAPAGPNAPPAPVAQHTASVPGPQATAPEVKPQNPNPLLPTPSAPPTAASAPAMQATPQQALMQRLTQAFAPPPVPSSSQPLPPSPSMVAATAQAAGQQQSAAPLLDALSRQLPSLPPQLAEAAARVLAGRLNVERGAPTAEALKAAVLRSGVLLAPAPKQGDPPDLKTALTQLKAALLGFLGEEVEPVAAIARRPPPPARGASPRGFTPDPPPPASQDHREAAKSLLGQTDGALSRLRLLQLTSHGNDAPRLGTAVPTPAEWNLELPLLLGRELAMAQIQISRDGKQKCDERERAWRLKFALKFSVLGEVGAQVAMVGRRASVALWADEVLTADTLEEMLPELGPALADKGLELASLTVRRGVPRDDVRPTGQLMDSRR